MFRKIADLVKHSIVYGLGSLSTRVVGFLLIPVYTRFMSPADYGILALCTATAGVIVPVAVSTPTHAVLKFRTGGGANVS